MDVLEILRILVYLYIKVTNFAATQANYKVTLKSKWAFLQSYTKRNARVTCNFQAMLQM